LNYVFLKENYSIILFDKENYLIINL